MISNSKTYIQFVIGALAGAAGMALYLFLRDFLQIQPPGWTAAIAILLFAIITGVLIHELGHLIAGKIVGFIFYMFSIGPLKIQKYGDKIRPGINKHLNIGGGLTLMLPRESVPDDSKMFWFIAGGPLANFILGLTSVMIPLISDASTENPAVNFAFYVLFTAGFVSFMLGLIAIIPSESDAFESDGSQILDLYRGGEKAIIKQQLTALTLTQWNGTRLRNIDKNILDSLLEKTDSETNSQALTVRFIAAYYHLDSKNIDEAEDILDSLIEQLKTKKNPILEGTVFTEKAFILSAYKKDTEDAKTFLEKGRNGFVEKQTIARAESAFLIAKGDIKRGMERAKEGLDAADNSPDKGGVIFEKEILTQLSRGELPNLIH